MRIRINNIECRQTIYKQREYEIIKWQKNNYYGTEEKLLSEGFERVEYDNGDWGMQNGNYTVNSSCFKNPESCYVIAWLEPNYKEPDVNMCTVGGRLLELEQSELNTFMKVYKIAHELIMEKVNWD